MSAEEQAFVLARSWPHLNLGDQGDYATTESAITRITGGNFRLTVRLIGQIERIMKINKMSVITKEVVEAARENLVTAPCDPPHATAQKQSPTTTIIL